MRGDEQAKDSTPGVPIEAHVATAMRQLARSLDGRRRVYLDKCYWIQLRDAELQRPRSDDSKRLLKALRHGVMNGSLICPIGEAVFLELMKQEDSGTRLATASLIDEFSQGVCLRPRDERTAAELRHMLRSKSSFPVEPVTDSVWTKLPYVLGMQHPMLLGVAAAEQTTVQTSFFDLMWDFPLTRILERLSVPSLAVPRANLAVDGINQANLEHADSITTFRNLYLDEVRGSLADLVPVALAVLQEMKLEAGRAAEHLGARGETEIYRMMHNLLCKAIEREDVVLALRTTHLSALCHAAVRWDRKRKLKPNDLLDFVHAEAAVGYFDAFFTEGPLRSLLLQKHLRIDEQFPCRIISSARHALEWIDKAQGRERTPA